MKDFLDNFRYLNKDMPRSSKIMFGGIGVLLLILLLGKVTSNPRILITVAILMFSIILHELAHGLVAYANGDKTAKYMGRLTLNPISHIDPVGMLFPIVLILMGSGFVIGWAKPVPVNYRNLRKGEWSVFQVSIAGVLTNFLLAFIGATFIKFFPDLFLGNETIRMGVSYLIRINLVLGVFNLLPIPPLDGSKVLWCLGERKLKEFIENLNRYGIFIILGLSYMGILWKIIGPIYGFLVKILNLYIN